MIRKNLNECPTPHKEVNKGHTYEKKNVTYICSSKGMKSFVGEIPLPIYFALDSSTSLYCSLTCSLYRS